MPFPTPLLPIAVEALLGGWIHLYFLVNFLKNQAISFHKWFRLKAVLHLATQHCLIGTRCFASFILRNIVRETLHSLPYHRVIILTRFVRKQSHAIHNNDIWKAKCQIHVTLVEASKSEDRTSQITTQGRHHTLANSSSEHKAHPTLFQHLEASSYIESSQCHPRFLWTSHA